MTSRGQCPRGGGVLVNVLTPPPPSGNPVSAPEMDPPPLSKILDPPLSRLHSLHGDGKLRLQIEHLIGALEHLNCN